MPQYHKLNPSTSISICSVCVVLASTELVWKSYVVLAGLRHGKQGDFNNSTKIVAGAASKVDVVS